MRAVAEGLVRRMAASAEGCYVAFSLLTVGSAKAKLASNDKRTVLGWGHLEPVRRERRRTLESAFPKCPLVSEAAIDVCAVTEGFVGRKSTSAQRDSDVFNNRLTGFIHDDDVSSDVERAVRIYGDGVGRVGLLLGAVVATNEMQRAGRTVCDRLGDPVWFRCLRIDPGSPLRIKGPRESSNTFRRVDAAFQFVADFDVVRRV